MKELSTVELLANYAELLNTYGPGSEEELQFVRDREFDIEFANLAKTAKLLKEAAIGAGLC
jgi:hypothetical protein